MTERREVREGSDGRWRRCYPFTKEGACNNEGDIDGVPAHEDPVDPLVEPPSTSSVSGFHC